MKYTIPIVPVAWKRAGHSGRHFYDQQQHEKLAFGLYMAQQHDNEPPFTTAFELRIVFFMPQPYARLQRWKSLGKEEFHHSTIPDLDNLEKHILDTAQQANIITNDKLCCSCCKRKIYDKNPRVEFYFIEIDPYKIVDPWIW